MDVKEIGLSSRGRTPVILSAEVAECGLACLVMIARYHGLNVDLNGLRLRVSSSAIEDFIFELFQFLATQPHSVAGLAKFNVDTAALRQH